MIAIFIIIAELDYDISGLVTGLGLTSVVIALAAQDLAESLLSGFAIASDKPFLVGDYVKIGEFEGTVTDIKFRCTRIRTPDDSIVTIQNSTITKNEVINYSRRRKRRIDISVNLPLDTKAGEIENITLVIKDTLEAEQNVISDSVRVYVDKIENTAIKLGIYLYTEILDYDEFLNFQTRINLAVMNTLENEGITVSYPGQNVYLQR